MQRGNGALAGVAVFMLYLYYSAFIMLVGAEVNQIIEEHAPGGKDPGEKAPEQHVGESQDGNHAPHVVRESRPRQSEAVGSHPPDRDES